ncbi:MAG: hypothetical protein H6765_01710 [Candidatus Peribacteria bacterium]|nr:MAG: hypothetical protein H6765_01710 [Candidatus Peribacteria bacterium]
MFMAKLDDRLEDKNISPRMDWLFGTCKWYLLRIIERTFPREVTESTNSSTKTTTKTTTTSTTKSSTSTSNTEVSEPKTDGNYRLIDVDARKRTFMPAVVEVKKGMQAKLVVHDVDLKHDIYFPKLQVWKDGNGFYILDTSTAGSYSYYCSASCGEEYQKMV